MEDKIICIVGPTATGKTALSIELAKRLNGEIISADSMQIYKYMDIGTAKPTEEEKEGIRHYLIDEISPFDKFSVKEYVDLAKKYIEEIKAKNKQPIIVGGTGLYISSLIDNVKFNESEADEDLRKELLALAKERGNEYVHNMLKEIDYESYLRLHPNNLRRIIRAIELYKTTGITMTEQIKSSKKEKPPYNVKIIGLNTQRDILYDRINKRVDLMIENGLIEEVKCLMNMGLTLSYKSMQGIGYKEIIMYLNNLLTKEEAIDKIKTESRRYAKRQLTWFRKDLRVKWIDINLYNTKEKQYSYILKEDLI